MVDCSGFKKPSCWLHAMRSRCDLEGSTPKGRRGDQQPQMETPTDHDSFPVCFVLLESSNKTEFWVKFFRWVCILGPFLPVAHSKHDSTAQQPAFHQSSHLHTYEKFLHPFTDGYSCQSGNCVRVVTTPALKKPLSWSSLFVPTCCLHLPPPVYQPSPPQSQRQAFTVENTPVWREAYLWLTSRTCLSSAQLFLPVSMEIFQTGNLTLCPILRSWNLLLSWNQYFITELLN